MNSIHLLILIYVLTDHSMQAVPLTSRCQRTLTYKQILELLENNACQSIVLQQRQRRTPDDDNKDDQTIASTNNIYALQTTVNDHRVMIDDHRKMIHYLINNTVNITHLNQYYADQHARMKPVWKSWRDVCLLILLFICFSIIIIIICKRVHILDHLTKFLIRRHQNRMELEAKKSNPIRDYANHNFDPNELF